MTFQTYGLTGLFSMYSPRLRCCLSARAAALARWASRSLRQATYSGEPAATLLARQNVSSSSARVDVTGTSPRRAQADNARARNISARRFVRQLKRIRDPGQDGLPLPSGEGWGEGLRSIVRA